MKEKVLLAILSISAALSLVHFVLSFIIVPHIFGLLISITMLIFNLLYIIYLVKVKKKMSQDYKVQYEMMGRKNKDSCFTKTLILAFIVTYISLNILMFTMVTLRFMSLSVSTEFFNRTDFPYMCDPSAEEACARIVITKNSCFRVETLIDRFTLVYPSQINENTTIGYFALYCAQSMGISSL